MEPVFEEDALQKLHELAAGVPRQIARLADYALLAGAAANEETISSAIIDAAYNEDAWPATAGAY
jgi:type II secretory pathway predicted ATPase ExeA